MAFSDSVSWYIAKHYNEHYSNTAAQPVWTIIDCITVYLVIGTIISAKTDCTLTSYKQHSLDIYSVFISPHTPCLEDPLLGSAPLPQKIWPISAPDGGT